MNKSHTLRATVYIDVEVDEKMLKRKKLIRADITNKLEHFLKDCKTLHDFQVCEIDSVLDTDIYISWNQIPNDKREKIYLEEYVITLKPDHESFAI